ncbi:1-phosphatidylinositol phosphodiesterase-like [Microplitis demolitor]|uniref:1-phosphatidylinositol phosphodiesterase-like n=1 Tax=Microplitis demolitor TaxID=69319 RepID=UPI0004CD9B80|nr:1-phosphatidylinositol phosphodiesterase-like [Microplitis demolitor]
MCSSSFKCKKFIYKPYIERIKFLVRLPDTKKLCELALIGTHSSLSYSVSENKYQTQDLNLAQQLKYGIRVFDISVRLRSNIIESYSYYAETNVRFDGFLLEAEEFLDDNPGEFIIILIRQVYPPEFDVTRSHCDIINFYIRHVIGGRRIVTKWRLEDSIGQHRGKILLSSFDDSFSECAFDIRKNCKLQSNVTSKIKRHNYSVQDKWHDILTLIKDSHVENYKCFLNEIHFNDGSFNHFSIAKEGGDFNSSLCVSHPINEMMEYYFENPHRALIIVVADFVTQELMDKINDSNFPDSSWRIGWE